MIDAPYTDVKSFQDFIVSNMKTTELSEEQKRHFVEFWFQDPDMEVDVSVAVDHWKQGLEELLKYENPRYKP